MSARELAARQLSFATAGGEVSALCLAPPRPRWLLVLGHGAGAGMRHPFMEELAAILASQGMATLRYQFPYMEQGRRRPDARSVLLDTVQAAALLGQSMAEELGRDRGEPGDAGETVSRSLPLLVGGKSMGGRMGSQAAAEGRLPGVRGLVFFGFPLHPAGRPSTARATHLVEVDVPMLFLQGTRDRLADLDLFVPECRRLEDRATLHVVEDGDHSFHVLKRTGRTDRSVLEELGRVTAEWAGGEWMARAPNLNR